MGKFNDMFLFLDTLPDEGRQTDRRMDILITAKVVLPHTSLTVHPKKDWMQDGDRGVQISVWPSCRSWLRSA